LHEAPKRNKADFGGRQQIIFQATGELAGIRIPAAPIPVSTPDVLSDAYNLDSQPGLADTAQHRPDCATHAVEGQ
jgi:hypothetical protein